MTSGLTSACASACADQPTVISRQPLFLYSASSVLAAVAQAGRGTIGRRQGDRYYRLSFEPSAVPTVSYLTSTPWQRVRHVVMERYAHVASW